jgi:hypothetical protein
MPQSSSFLPVRSGHGMDVKSVSHLYKESRSLDTVRALRRGITLFTQQCRPRFTLSRIVQENLPSLFAWPRLLGSSICNVTVVEPPLIIQDTQTKDPQPLQRLLHAPPGDSDLPRHPLPIVEPGPQPPQVEPIPTQANTVLKVLAIRQEVGRVEAWAACIRRYTMQGKLFALLQTENEGITWKLYIWDLPCGVLKFAMNSSINMLPTLTSLKRWGKRASVNCQLCGNLVKQMMIRVLI